MSAFVGPYEAGLRERWLQASARLLAARSFPVRPKVRRPLSPFSPERRLTPSAFFVDLLSGPSWRVIAGLVAMKHGFRISTLQSAERSRPYVAARDEAMQLLATHTGMLTGDIGRRFNRDRTSVAHSLAKIGIVKRSRNTEWTEQMDADLTQLWLDRISLTDIGFVVGVTRNAAIARVVALDLPTRSGKPRATRDERHKRRPRMGAAEAALRAAAARIA